MALAGLDQPKPNYSQGILPGGQSTLSAVYQPQSPPGVSIMTCTNRPSRMENVILSYLRQNYQPKELIIVLNNNSMSLKDWQLRVQSYPGIKVLQADERITLGECYNLAVGHTNFDFVAKFDDDDYYAPNFLTGEMAVFDYTCADIVGKLCRFIYFQEFSTLGFYEASQFSYVPYVVGATMVIRKEVFNHIRFRDITMGEDSEFQKDCRQQGRKIFSVDKYNYVTIRHHSSEPHTYPLEDHAYLGYCLKTWKTRDYITPTTR